MSMLQGDDIELGEPVRYDESDGRDFEFNGTVLSEVVEGEEFFWKNPVPLHDSCRRIIGCVNLEEIDGAVEGHFILNYHTPERLNLETKSVRMYPKVYTETADMYDGLFLFQIMRVELVEQPVGEPL